jgi:sugar phosphate isomerase/epimerase
MEIVVFPKFYQPLGVAELARTLREIGFDGVDVMVRDGFWVTEESLARSLPEFVRILHDFGLSTLNATTDFHDASSPAVERGVACLAENGVAQYRLRGFPYRGAGTFRADFDAARRTLAQFAKLGEKHGIRAFLQTHGGTLHASATTTAWLVDGFDPAVIGVHHDPGNMICQEGYETWEKGFDALGDHLCMVGVKNAATFHVPQGGDYRLRWRTEWTTLAEGQVDWRAVLRALRQTEFDGPFCMHNFYERGLADLIAQTRRDLEYLKALLAEA